MDKVSFLGVKLEQWRKGRSQAKANRAREMLALSQGGFDSTGLMALPGRDGRRARKTARKVDRAERRGRDPNITASRKLRMKVAIEDRKEATASGGILWIVVMREDQDKQIEGTELADDAADVEEIDESEWEEELDMEDKEDLKDLKAFGDS
jgi:hypothetical protein